MPGPDAAEDALACVRQIWAAIVEALGEDLGTLTRAVRYGDGLAFEAESILLTGPLYQFTTRENDCPDPVTAL